MLSKDITEPELSLAKVFGRNFCFQGEISSFPLLFLQEFFWLFSVFVFSLLFLLEILTFQRNFEALLFLAMASLPLCLPLRLIGRPTLQCQSRKLLQFQSQKNGQFQLPTVRTCPLHLQELGGTQIRCTASRSSNEAASSPEPLEPTNISVDEKPWKPEVWIAIGVGIVAVGVAVTCFLTKGSLLANNQKEASQIISDLSGSKPPAQFTVNWFGRKFSLGERSPGWMYFSLLMAAGFGLFVSEEALNVWVGGTLGRCLIWNQSQEVFRSSISANLPYFASTIIWVYWGVCLSDLIPFYAGRLAAKSGSGNTIREKLGVSEEKFDQVKATVQRYGNLIGFVERFSLGVRNPTAFLAGFVGIQPARFFAGVCAGALFTLPLQMTIGFALRDHPVTALASVAAAVGIWTIFPYTAAAIASAVYFTKQRYSKQSS